MNMAQAIKKHKGAGGHFFDKDTMRFFGSRLETGLYAGRYFITSESINGLTRSNDPDRKYTIREFGDDFKRIDDVGEFQEHKTLDEAFAALDEIIASNRGDVVPAAI